MRSIEKCLESDDDVRVAIVKIWNAVGALDATPDRFVGDELKSLTEDAREADLDAWRALGYSENDLASELASARTIPLYQPYKHEQ